MKIAESVRAKGLDGPLDPPLPYHPAPALRDGALLPPWEGRKLFYDVMGIERL